jgi:hypothetical protein
VAEPEGQIPAAPTLDELLKSPGNNETTEEQLIESEIPGFLTIMLLKISTSMDMHVVRDIPYNCRGLNTVNIFDLYMSNWNTCHSNFFNHEN